MRDAWSRGRDDDQYTHDLPVCSEKYRFKPWKFREGWHRNVSVCGKQIWTAAWVTLEERSSKPTEDGLPSRIYSVTTGSLQDSRQRLLVNRILVTQRSQTRH